MRNDIQIFNDKGVFKMGKYQYQFNKDDLDEIINKISMGILPTGVPEEMMMEVRIREKEIRQELFDDDDDESMITDEEIQKYQETMAKRVEESRHKAHKEDIKVIKIGPKARERLKKSVSAALVRPDVTDYVKSDDELYSSEQERKLLEKMSRVKSRYQNPTDYRNAMNIIREFIDFKLKDENKNKSDQEIYEAYHAGQIKLNIRLPKLFSDFVHEITDPQILSDIAEGKVEIKTKSEVDDEMEIRDYSESPLMDEQPRIIGKAEYNQLVEDIANGDKNILTPINNSRRNVYKYSLPSTNRFGKNYGKVNKTNDPQTIPTINYYDDEQVEEVINKINGFDPSSPNNIVEVLNKSNNRALSIHTRDSITQHKKGNAFTNTMKQGDNPYAPRMISPTEMQPIERDPRTIGLEQGIIGSISAYDYNPY